MGVRNYYYLIAGLPDLTIDQGKLQFGSLEFREYLQTELHKKDYQLIEWLFLPNDNENLLNILNKKEAEWNIKGIYTKEELELAITEVVAPDKIIMDEKSGVKPYITEFLNSYFGENRLMPSLKTENELSFLYFADALKVKNDFLKSWFEFEINLKNLLIFNTARKFNVSYENELIGETQLTQSLKHKTSHDSGDVAEYQYFDRINQISENTDIATREKAIDQLRWTFLDEMNISNYFSIEVVISYIIKLMIIERWLKLDPKTGEELFRRLLGDLQTGYEFPNEFSVK
ncbi:MAG: DUF2764 family protein [Omnitrophica WOR_2 bacterium]